MSKKHADVEARVLELEQRVSEIEKEMQTVAHIRPTGSSYQEMVDGLIQSVVEDTYKGGKEETLP